MELALPELSLHLGLLLLKSLLLLLLLLSY
jgi:hypothetical protein